MSRFIRGHRTYTILGIVFAILAAILLLSYVLQVRSILPKSGKLINIPTAKKDLQRGIPIREEDLSIREWPENYLPPDTIKKTREAIGAAVTQEILKGEPISARRVLKEGDEGGLSARIPVDMRAYTLSLGREAGLHPCMAPGDHVDVLVTLGDPPSTRTILSEKEILESGLDNEEGAGLAGEAATLTLLLSPQEVEALAFARTQGDISISLCSLRQADAKGH